MNKLITVNSAKRNSDGKLLMSIHVIYRGQDVPDMPFVYDVNDPEDMTNQVTLWLIAHPEFKPT